ncbi:tail sheath stabilizer and completion protein [Candidatus Dojkabacteria bacterium]|jgi:hypothetical protein|nr:tail sheath stabilizer and completion protein [Candidatus Dojkabacteria bacterium]
MLGNDHFYHRSIRKVVVTFGTLFNDLELVRFSTDGTPKERFKVPLIYGPKEKYIVRLMSDPNLTKSISTVVPRLSFNLDSIAYDQTRKQATTIRNFKSSNGTVISQYVPVPFNFEFSLSIFVRNTEDGTQILEQILPFFTPDFTVTIDFINTMDKKYDVPIILKTVTSNDTYEGSLDETRLITWDLTFTAKGYIFPPIKSSEIIREVNVNMAVQPNTALTPLVNINVVPNPLDASPEDDFGFTETITENK